MIRHDLSGQAAGFGRRAEREYGPSRRNGKNVTGTIRSPPRPPVCRVRPNAGPAPCRAPCRALAVGAALRYRSPAAAAPPSSSGLGRRPLTPETGVRFPLGAPAGANVSVSEFIFGACKFQPIMAQHSVDMKNAALTDAYISLRRTHNDLRVVAGADVNPSGFTLLAILRNEMYFLPAFLAHYRQLGVERFVFLNDRSDDGSFEYICKQPDTVVVESNRAYGEPVRIPPQISENIGNLRMMDLWRSMLHDIFAQDRWALQVDLDEFVRLPAKMSFPRLVAQLDKHNACAVWGVMLDVYPRDIATLAEQKNSSQLDPLSTWYFDGEMHLRLRKNKKPKIVYPGARSRLYTVYSVHDLVGQKKQLKQRSIGNLFVRKRFPNYTQLRKPTLLKWQENSFFMSSHNCNLPFSDEHLLPIQHFRFTGCLHRKITATLHEKSHHKESFDYRRLAALLQIMEEKNGTFLYPNSRPLEAFSDLEETKNARGLSG